MKALSGSSRVRGLKLLQDGELCVCNIQSHLQLAQSSVSRRMKVLEDAGLVQRRRQGTWIMYKLSAKHDSAYEVAMLTHLERWLEDDKKLKQMRLQRNLNISKETHCTV